MRRTRLLLIPGLLLAGCGGAAASGQDPPDNTNTVAFWCGSEDAGVKFELGEDGSFTVPEPPEGTVWTLLVIKAGSGEGENFVVENPVVGQTYTHPSGKDISHVILCFSVATTTTTSPPTTSTTVPETTSTVPETTSTVPETTTTVPETTTTVPETTTTETTTTVPGTTTTVPETTTTVPGETTTTVPGETTTTAPGVTTTTQPPSVVTTTTQPPAPPPAPPPPPLPDTL